MNATETDRIGPEPRLVPRTWAEAVSRPHCELPDPSDDDHEVHDMCGWIREDDSL